MAHLDILVVMFLQHLQVCGYIGLNTQVTHSLKHVETAEIDLRFLLFPYLSPLFRRDSHRWTPGSERAAACRAARLYVQTVRSR